MLFRLTRFVFLVTYLPLILRPGGNQRVSLFRNTFSLHSRSDLYLPWRGWNMLVVGSPALPVAPLQKKGVLCWVFPRATRPACLARVSCSTLGVFCEAGHILSCDGGALVLCSHAGSRFELCISSHAMGDAGSCVSLATLICVMFLHLHAAIFVGVSTAGACSSRCHQRTASQ